MAELCTRKGCVAEIERIVKRAEEKIVLVSPYIDADENILERLKQKTAADVQVVVIHGKKKNQPQAKSLLEMRGVTKIFVKDLHAKCYLNESKALVTSMNLYNYSQKYNEEMGILVTKEVDRQLYDEVIEEVRHWEEMGEKQSPTAAIELKTESMEPPKSRRKATRSKSRDGEASRRLTEDELDKILTRESKARGRKPKIPSVGSCIRCGEGVVIDPTDLKPYCLDCFKKWKKSKQTVKHREKHCHVCGKDHKASLDKPGCLPCYEKYNDVIDFKSAVEKVA